MKPANNGLLSTNSLRLAHSRRHRREKVMYIQACVGRATGRLDQMEPRTARNRRRARSAGVDRAVEAGGSISKRGNLVRLGTIAILDDPRVIVPQGVGA